MGFMGICIDFLAWPLIALTYPIFAAIRAFETGLKHHMRKLVTYWTLFSIVISLFEFPFVKIIERIPCWSIIKLIAIFWLVMTLFDGACTAFGLLIRPCLRVVHKLQKTEIFLDIAEKHIKQNAVEAWEKLISSKVQRDFKEPDNSHRDVQVLEPEEKDAAPISKQKENDAAAEVKEMTQIATDKSDQGNAYATKSKVGQGSQQKDAAAEVKEMMPMEPTATTRHLEIPPLKEEWSCDLCEVKTRSQETLNAHLQGNKHKSKYESLKASSLLATGKSNQGNTETAKSNVEQGSQLISSKEKVPNHQQMQDGASTQQFKLRCDVCNVKLLSEIDMASHLKGKRHSANIDKMTQFLGSVFKLQCDVCDVKLLSEIELASHLKGKRHSTNIDKMGSLKVPFFKVRCNVCNVTLLNEIDLASHLKGKRHSANIDEMAQFKGSVFKLRCNVCNVKLLNEIDLTSHLKGKQHLANTNKMVQFVDSVFKLQCDVCDVKLLSEIDLTSHLKGKRHSANIDKIPQFEGSLFKVRCNVCNVTLLSEIDLASHLKGKRHSANIDKMAQFKGSVFKLRCNVCNVKLLSEIDLASHLEGKRHSANIDKMAQFKGSIFKLQCNLCNVKLLSDIDLASHLKGKQHSANI